MRPALTNALTNAIRSALNFKNQPMPDEGQFVWHKQLEWG